MAKTTLVQQLSVQKSENLKAVELFLTTRALFHTLKSLVFRQNRQAQATVKFKRMSGKINSVNATFTILIHLTSRIDHYFTAMYVFEKFLSFCIRTETPVNLQQFCQGFVKKWFLKL